MTTCVFPGSFDPVTIGHLNLISRASRLFDQVTVTLMVNIHKKSAIPAEKRIELLKEACRPYGNVIVDSWDGLLADYMQKKNLFQELFFSNKNFVWRENFFIMNKK